MAKERSVSVTLSAETADALDALAERFGVSRPEMINRLVHGTAPQENPDASGD